ncbi:BON domain-containing protein [Actinocrinis sp.]|uniref:BON domain-containing protein n=1 Tax=Actinocrinis sp. TaxID=1920516 RepID=UPI002D6D1665|nr:BON domain-containing protein [Actinocrinis sp.]HZP51342.1 BON domain-containing protein [Actinocrinis sp.]
MNAISPTDDEIRRRVVDRVIDVGGEVLDVKVTRGAVRLRGRVGEPGEIALAGMLLRRVDGVDSVVAQFTLLDEVSEEPTRG